MAFRIGQKVVCVVDKKTTLHNYKLIKGEVYTCNGYSQINEGEILILEQPIYWHKEKYCCAPDDWFKPLELDHSFVEEAIKQVTPKEQEA